MNEKQHTEHNEKLKNVKYLGNKKNKNLDKVDLVNQATLF